MPHADIEGLGLLRAGDDDFVVVAQRHYRALFELGLVDLFATGIEIVAIDEREAAVCHAIKCNDQVTTRPRDDAANLDIHNPLQGKAGSLGWVG
jgi:hypothetical protein